MSRNQELFDGYINARNHNFLPNIVSTHPDNPTLRYHMREHTEKLGVGDPIMEVGVKSVLGGYQRSQPLEGEPKKECKAKKPPKAIQKGAFPEPGMASATKPCKSYEPSISIGHEHACGNCGWNHR